jgi:galactitol-specific phosphotransferase system IIC component
MLIDIESRWGIFGMIIGFVIGFYLGYIWKKGGKHDKSNQ